MATISVVFSEVSGGSAGGGARPVSDGIPLSAEYIASTGSSKQSVNSSPSPTCYCTITATGGGVWVKFGENPTAAAGSDWLVLNGQTRDFKVGKGTKVAVIDI